MIQFVYLFFDIVLDPCPWISDYTIGVVLAVVKLLTNSPIFLMRSFMCVHYPISVYVTICLQNYINSCLVRSVVYNIDMFASFYMFFMIT